MAVSRHSCNQRLKYGRAAVTTATVAATRATGNARSTWAYPPSGGRPPSVPSTSADRTHRSHAVAPDTAMSRMAESRRDIRVMKAITAMTPSEVIHQMDEISQLTPSGGEPSVVAMVCSRFELVLVPNQHTRSATAARPSLTASEPRRRV